MLTLEKLLFRLIAAGFKATLPKGNNLDARPEGDDEVILGIDAGGNYFLNGRSIAMEAVGDQLKGIYAAREKDKILYFKADNQLKYAKIQEGVEIARQSGVRVLSAITEEKQDGGLLGKPKKRQGY